MATGIRRRHSKGCRSRGGGRCNCAAGWEASVYLAREGKKVRKTFRHEAEAKSWRADAVAAANRGALRPARRDIRTLAAGLREFVDGMKAGTVRPKGRVAYKPNTVRAYERALMNHIEPSRLGRLKIADVRRADVQALADELLAEGLAPGTVSNVLNPVQALYRRLIDRDALTHNPATRLDLPAKGNARPKRIASSAEAAELLAALPDNDRPLWAAAFYAGLRRGELQALRVLDVDLGASLIRVERGWDQYEGAIAPKSSASRRTIPLLALLRDHLDEHLIRTGRDGAQLVFGRTAEDPFAPPVTDQRGKDAWEAAGLQPITLHEARHTFASLMIAAGANAKAVQEFMGHSKIQTTFDTYGHLLPGSHDEVRERMDAYLLGASEAAVEAAEDAA
jgi:integrase